MLVDPPFARWIVSGEGSPVPGAQGRDEAERFAAYEGVVRSRTNRFRRVGGGVNPPWPRALGTPPWGLRTEMQTYGSLPGTSYEFDALRPRGAGALARIHRRLTEVVVEGEPAILYVGNAQLPRHVTLILPGPVRGSLEVYEPHAGTVTDFGADAFARRELTLGGWRHPWLVIRPTGHRRARADETHRLQLPTFGRQPSAEPLQRSAQR